jgi:hypothetical protein
VICSGVLGKANSFLICEADFSVENGKSLNGFYLGIGINIMQDNGELIDTGNFLTMEQYQTLYKSCESEYDNFRHFCVLVLSNNF